MSGTSMQIEIMERDATECRIRVDGEIDMATVGAFGTALNAIVDTAPPGARVLVDAGEVKFLSAAGVCVLVQTSRRIREVGGVFVVDPVSPIVERVLRACGCDDMVGLVQVSVSPAPRAPGLPSS